jgi:hypothetical protein
MQLSVSFQRYMYAQLLYLFPFSLFFPPENVVDIIIIMSEKE